MCPVLLNLLATTPPNKKKKILRMLFQEGGRAGMTCDIFIFALHFMVSIFICIHATVAYTCQKPRTQFNQAEISQGPFIC